MKLELKSALLIKNRSALINIGLIILALVIAKSIYSSQIKNIEKLKVDKEAEFKKNAIINDISQVEKKINLYKDVFLKSDTSSIINSITLLASDSQVKITSLKPEPEKEYSTHSELSVRLNIIATDYHKIGDFISKLESASEFFIIDDFLIKPQQEQEGPKGGINRLSADLTVTAVMFKG